MSPDFRDLIGDDVPADEEARLRRIHDLLVTAGPPEELPPSLAEPPAEGRRSNVVAFPVRRRLGAALVAAAALAATLFGGGYWIGAKRNSFEGEHTYVMRGPSPSAFASLRMAPADAAFNWPLELHVRGLKDLPKGGYYELLLTKNGKLGLSCGTFRTHDGKTTIVLNAPYPLRRWNGWVVIAHEPDGQTSAPVLSTHLS